MTWTPSTKLALLGSVVAVAGCGQPEPTTLEECRAHAARVATTEIGARAMLSDCGKRFASAVAREPATLPEVSEEECHRRGGHYGTNYVTNRPSCVEPKPCTDADKAHNDRVRFAIEARARATETECRQSGDAWDQETKTCRARTFAQELTVVCMQ